MRIKNAKNRLAAGRTQSVLGKALHYTRCRPCTYTASVLRAMVPLTHSTISVRVGFAVSCLHLDCAAHFCVLVSELFVLCNCTWLLS